MPGIFGGVGCDPHLYEILQSEFALALGLLRINFTSEWNTGRTRVSTCTGPTRDMQRSALCC